MTLADIETERDALIEQRKALEKEYINVSGEDRSFNARRDLRKNIRLLTDRIDTLHRQIAGAG